MLLEDAADELRGSIVKAYVVLRPGERGSTELAKDIQDSSSENSRRISIRERSSSSKRCRERIQARLSDMYCGIGQKQNRDYADVFLISLMVDFPNCRSVKAGS